MGQEGGGHLLARFTFSHPTLQIKKRGVVFRCRRMTRSELQARIPPQLCYRRILFQHLLPMMSRQLDSSDGQIQIMI